VAVLAGTSENVENLVELFSAEELKLEDDRGCTALAMASLYGFDKNIGMVDCMLTKNIDLLNIPNNLNFIPLVWALVAGSLKLARYLYSVYLPHQILRDIDASTALYFFIYQNQFGKDTGSNYFFFF
jgi:ankyrin repeat protein